MTSFNIKCGTCGEDTNYSDQQRFIDAVKAHPKGHAINLRGQSKTLNKEDMNVILADILQQVKK